MIFKYTGSNSLNELLDKLPDRGKYVQKSPDPTLFYIFDSHNYIMNNMYKLLCIAVDSAGGKVCFIINSIEVYLEILPHDEGAMEKVRDILSQNRSVYLRIEEIQRKPFIGYSPEQKPGFRIYFNNTRNRDILCKQVRDFCHVGCNAKRSNFPGFVSREYGINLMGWNKICDYFPIAVDTIHYDRVYSVNIDNVTGMDIDIRPPLLLMGWDLETGDSGEYGGVPKAHEPNSYIDICSLSFNWYMDNEPVETVCLTTRANSYATGLIINCETEYELLICFGAIVMKLDPDFVLDFNGFSFDWKFIFWKSCTRFILYKECITLQDWIRSCFNRINEPLTVSPVIDLNKESSRSIKVLPNNNWDCYFMLYPGRLCIDMRVACIRQKNNDDVMEASSLNYFLEKAGLEPKVDLSIDDLNIIRAIQEMCIVKSSNVHELIEQHEKGNTMLPELSHKIRNYGIHKMSIQTRIQYLGQSNKMIEYCNYDALCCVLLCNKHSLLTVYQEMAILTRMNSSNVVYNAIGSKVLNLVALECTKRGYVIDEDPNISNRNKERYDGAYIVPPVVKYYNVPVGVLDIQSEYPSVCISWNISPETCLMDPDYEYPGRVEQIRYNYGEGKKEERQEEIARFIQAGAGEMGIFPSLLLGLKKYRSSIKRRQGICVGLLKSEIDRESVDDIKVAEILSHEDPTGELSWQAAALDIKQINTKIMMNSFYGICGCHTNPIYMLPVAGSIASKAREATKFMQNIAESYKYKVIYGDTDSIFITKPSIQITDDREDMIRAHKEEMTQMQNEINIGFESLTGSSHLRVEYEKTLFPFVLCGMKNYIGYSHGTSRRIDMSLLKCDRAEFERRGLGGELLIKGELSGKNTTKICKDIIIDLLYQLMTTVRTDITTHDIIEYVILNIFKMYNFDNIKDVNDLESFIIKAKYKKSNQDTNHIKKFINYMELVNTVNPDINLYIPLNDERFGYVVTDIPVRISGHDNHDSYVLVQNFFNRKFRKYKRLNGLGISKPHYLDLCCRKLAKIVYSFPEFISKDLEDPEIFYDHERYKKARSKNMEKTAKKLFNMYLGKFNIPQNKQIRKETRIRYKNAIDKLPVSGRHGQMIRALLVICAKYERTEIIKHLRSFIRKDARKYAQLVSKRRNGNYLNALKSHIDRRVFDAASCMIKISESLHEFKCNPEKFPINIEKKILGKLVMKVSLCSLLQARIEKSQYVPNIIIMSDIEEYEMQKKILKNI